MDYQAEIERYVVLIFVDLQGLIPLNKYHCRLNAIFHRAGESSYISR